MSADKPPSPHSDQSFGNVTEVFGSLETLTRGEQQALSAAEDHQERNNGMLIFLTCGVFTMVGAGLLALISLFAVKSLFLPQMSQTDALGGYPGEYQNLAFEDELEISATEFATVKNKLHRFFSLALNGKAQKPIKLGEKEVNAFLKYDSRLGGSRNTTLIKIKKNRIQAFFSINLMDANFLSRESIISRGNASFRAGMLDGQLQLNLDSLHVNNKNMFRWLHRIHNSSLRQTVSNGLKRIAKIPMGWIGKDVKIRTGTKPVKIYLTFSDDPTGEMFESISYQGNSVMNSIFGPLQKHTFNRIFKVHSRLHDLALALNRVEVNDGHIILYPRMGSTK
ncbi:MAG TPA: hypothetical protein DHV39_09555 [Verrucomicrobiales bacterium]|nr:hypothetical protein [Verrucomicrobiales bacterium]HCZ03647.1 hypothetical protein [Verrucomicrobiales bacterium]